MPVDSAQSERQLPSRHLRRGVGVSVASIAWNVAASSAEVVIGVTHQILTLVVFGLAGALDAAGSVTLVVHLRHALRHDVISERHERRAMLVVSVGLIALGVLTVVESGRRLAEHHVGSATTLGTTIAAVSVVVLAILAGAKHHVGRRMDSGALIADGWLSASGAVLAVIAVVGAALTGRDSGRWWVDPLAASVIAAIAAVYGTVVLAREQRRHMQSSAP